MAKSRQKKTTLCWRKCAYCRISTWATPQDKGRSRGSRCSARGTLKESTLTPDHSQCPNTASQTATTATITPNSQTSRVWSTELWSSSSVFRCCQVTLELDADGVRKDTRTGPARRSTGARRFAVCEPGSPQRGRFGCAAAHADRSVTLLCHARCFLLCARPSGGRIWHSVTENLFWETILNAFSVERRNRQLKIN